MEIQAPDGTKVQFPDGTPDDVVLRVMRQNYGGKQPVSTTEDVGKSLVSGVTSIPGGILGLPGTLREGGEGLARKSLQWVGGKLGLSQEVIDREIGSFNEAMATSPRRFPTSTEINKGVEENLTEPIGMVGPNYKPQTTPGKFAKVGGEFALGAASPGGLVSKALNVAVPTVASEGLGQLADQYAPAAAPYARVAGALAGPAAAAKLVTPVSTSARQGAAVDRLAEQGVTELTAGQKTGSPVLQAMETKIGNTPGTGFAAERIADEGQRQLTGRVMRENGASPGSVADAATLQGRHEAVGGGIKDISARNTVNLDTQLEAAMTNVARDYLAKHPPSEVRERFLRIADDILNHPPNMAGTKYQDWRSNLTDIYRSAKARDPEFADAVKGLRNALDDAARRSISPADAAQYDKLRQQYAALKTAETTAPRKGSEQIEGLIDPQRLGAVVEKNVGPSAYARGQGPMTELARDAAGVMTPIQRAPLSQPSMSGMVMGIPQSLVGRAMMSTPGQAYLGNRIYSPEARAGAKRIGVLDALLAGQR